LAKALGGTTADDSESELDEVLAELEGATNYKAWVLEVLRPFTRGHVLEIGAGRGTYARELRGLGQSLTAVEPSARLIPPLRQQLADLSDVTVINGTLIDVADKNFDTAVMLNVLEHVDDDRSLLADISARLVPGGTVCIWVPAFPALFGEFDRLVGHCRRYRKRDLESLLVTGGFTIIESRYANLPGFFAWWLIVRLLGAKPTAGHLSTIYDRWFIPAIRAVEKRLKPPFGQSLFVVARRP
jgi:SAM-dependent methyltransferase